MTLPALTSDTHAQTFFEDLTRLAVQSAFPELLNADNEISNEFRFAIDADTKQKKMTIVAHAIAILTGLPIERLKKVFKSDPFSDGMSIHSHEHVPSAALTVYTILCGLGPARVFSYVLHNNPVDLHSDPTLKQSMNGNTETAFQSAIFFFDGSKHLMFHHQTPEEYFFNTFYNMKKAFLKKHIPHRVLYSGGALSVRSLMTGERTIDAHGQEILYHAVEAKLSSALSIAVNKIKTVLDTNDFWFLKNDDFQNAWIAPDEDDEDMEMLASFEQSALIVSSHHTPFDNMRWSTLGDELNKQAAPLSVLMERTEDIIGDMQRQFHQILQAEKDFLED